MRGMAMRLPTSAQEPKPGGHFPTSSDPHGEGRRGECEAAPEDLQDADQ
jgi:hypothetical protein